jgi:hypothetical protein
MDAIREYFSFVVANLMQPAGVSPFLDIQSKPVSAVY